MTTQEYGKLQSAVLPRFKNNIGTKNKIIIICYINFY
jgi:hypothetical protein